MLRRLDKYEFPDGYSLFQGASTAVANHGCESHGRHVRF